jgi:hypothetical protein
MSTRYTKRDAEAAFARLTSAYGFKTGKLIEGTEPDGSPAWNTGVYFLDTDGGYQVRQLSGNTGGQAQPFGSRRYTASEFVHMCGFAIDALHQSRNQES